MKSSLAILTAGLVLVLSVVISSDASAQSGGKTSVVPTEVRNLTGLTLEEGWIEAILADALNDDQLLRFRGALETRSSIGTPAVDVLQNPFRVTGTGGHPLGDSCLITVDVERVEYTRPEEGAGDFALFWAFGVLGPLFKSEKAIGGLVQLRGRVSCPGSPEPVMHVSIGQCLGDLSSLDRAVALDVAARRAVKMLVIELGFKANEAWKMQLGSRSRSMTQLEYREYLDAGD